MLLSQINFSRFFRSPLKTVGFLANPLASFLPKFNGSNGDSGRGGGGAGPRGPSGGIGLPGLDIS